MGLFTPAEIAPAKLKMALMGFQGSGKTYTATDVAIGLVKMMRALRLPEGNRPIYFADTERGSRWVLPRVKQAGFPISTTHTRAFADLCGIINEAETNASVLLIDSLTHFWTEFCDTYAAAKAEEYHRQTYRLQFQDWAFLKARWRQFTDRFVNSNLHIVVAGRAGYEYDMIENDDTHKKQLEKTGIKFKAEGEMGYEPDLLVLMERRMNMDTKADEHIGHVVKDRSTLLDGQEFIDPTFANFLPHIECLNLNLNVGRAPEISIDTTRTSAAAIPPGEPRDRSSLLRAVVIDEINDLLMRHDAAGAGKDAQKKRSDLMQRNFGTVSKTKIEELMALPDLKAGFASLYLELTGTAYAPQASGLFTAAVSKQVSLDMNDALPDHSAPPAQVIRGTFDHIKVKPQQQMLPVDDQLAPLGSPLSDEARAKIERHVDSLTALDAG